MLCWFKDVQWKIWMMIPLSFFSSMFFINQHGMQLLDVRVEGQHDGVFLETMANLAQDFCGANLNNKCIGLNHVDMAVC